MRQALKALTVAAGLWLAGGVLPTSAMACPMCKAANETDQDGEPNTRPQAYMYSILFMLAMPATLLGAFGIAFWRVQKNAQLGEASQLPDDIHP